MTLGKVRLGDWLHLFMYHACCLLGSSRRWALLQVLLSKEKAQFWKLATDTEILKVS